MTVLPEVAPDPDREAVQLDGAIISGIALELRRDAFPRGDLAALRRLDPDHPDAPAFWLCWCGPFLKTAAVAPTPSSGAR